MSDERKIFGQFLGQYGGPAFARRARDVQFTYDALIDACRRQRDEWLTFVRLSLGTLFALAGSSSALAALVESDERLRILEALRDELQPSLRVPPSPTANVRTLRNALAELHDAIGRFNERWQTFIANLDLGNINQLRDRYNRFYLLEKECALGSSRLARQGFQKLQPLTPDDILKIMPLLPAP